MQLGDLDVNDLRKEAQPQLLTGISASIGPKAGGPADGGAGIRVATIDNYQVRDTGGIWRGVKPQSEGANLPG